MTREIEIELAAPSMSAEIFAPPGMEELTNQIQGMFQNMGGGRKKSRKLKIPEAMKLLVDEEAAKLINDEEVKLDAVKNVEQNGIVFLDEIDKIASRSDAHGADVSRQGVQRDLLPLVRSTTVVDRVRHDQDRSHPCFIASGASISPNPRPDPELQGAFPDPRRTRIAVGDGFRAYPHQTDACLTKAIRGLLATEGVHHPLCRRRHPAAGRDRLVGQQAHREHRRPPPLHGDGAPAGRPLVRRRCFPAPNRCWSMPAIERPVRRAGTEQTCRATCCDSIPSVIRRTADQQPLPWRKPGFRRPPE